jgi:Fur family transcriptional regulator, peroxide stress response regulator
MDRSPASLERRMDHLIGRCRERGMNVTPQRMAIYRVLLESEDHPSPEALYERVRPAMPSLSLATIYKALDVLGELGLVQEVSVPGVGKRYDANLERHHHLVCTRCKQVVDHYDPQLDALRPPRRLPGFVAHSVSVQLLGLCTGCARTPR